MRNTIKQALESQQLTFQTVTDGEEKSIFKLGISLGSGRADTFIDVRPAFEQVMIFTVCPTKVPSLKRGRISELLTRANHGLTVGNFEMDYQDGEVRYKGSFNYDERMKDSQELFLRNLYTTFHMMDKFLPGIMSVIYADTPPKEAIKQIEELANPQIES